MHNYEYESPYMQKQVHDGCRFNPIGVKCLDVPRDCTDCGHNPRVVARRKAQIRNRVAAGEKPHCYVKKKEAKNEDSNSQ